MKPFASFLRANAALTIGLALGMVFLVAAIAPQVLARASPVAMDMTAVTAPPSALHWFGTDHIGRDVYARVVYGTRVTLGVVSLSLLFAAIVGGTAGALAGYRSGLIDSGLSQLAEVVLGFPPVILGVMITGILGASISNLALALWLVFIPIFFRVARSVAMVETRKPYVDAAQGLGASKWRVLFTHIVPNVAPTVIVQYLILFPIALQIQAALGFLGLGVQPPTPDWGSGLHESKDYVLYAPWMAVFPGLALLLSSIFVMLLGRGLQRITDE